MSFELRVFVPEEDTYTPVAGDFATIPDALDELDRLKLEARAGGRTLAHYGIFPKSH